MRFPSFHFTGPFAGILILSCLYLSSCKKTESTTTVPAPDLSTQLLGQYEVQVVTITNLPVGITINPASVTVSVQSNSALDAVKLTTAYSYTLINGVSKRFEQVEQSKIVQLQQSGVDVAVYDADTRVGYWNKGTLNLVNYQLRSSILNVVAVKR